MDYDALKFNALSNIKTFFEMWPYSKIIEFSVAFLIHSLSHTDLDERFSSILEGDGEDETLTLTFTLTITLTFTLTITLKNRSRILKKIPESWNRATASLNI
jgi:hypothetical protein